MSNRSRPIVILGAARSGTKFLRDILGVSSAVAATPYDLNYIWRTGNESYPDDALPQSLCHDHIREHIKSELLKAAGIGEGSDHRRLVEKTVSNTVRVPFVARVFQDADFVHIIRDGRAVVASSLRQWQAGTDWRYLLRKARTFPLRNFRYGLWYLRGQLRAPRLAPKWKVWGVRYPGIDADMRRFPVAVICGRQWLNSVSSVREICGNGGMPRYREIRYEDLIASDTALAELAEWLNLPDVSTVVDRYRATLSVTPERPWSDVLLPNERDAVLNDIEPLLRTLEYV